MAGALTSETSCARSIAITGGGTAGHVFPAVAVAQELRLRWGGRLFWIGSRSGIESGLVERAGIEFKAIPAGKLRRYLSLRNLTDVARIFAGILSSVRILRRERPALLFSKGGFVSVPPVIAAALCRIPSFTHESDYDPGLATRINMRFCEKILLSFAETLDFVPSRYSAKTVVTGNPVRASLRAADPAKGRRIAGCDAGTPLLLVIGGSQGSSFINRLMASCLPALREGLSIVHQMGEKEYRPSRERGYLTAPFFADELPHLVAAADLVVSRAGANMLSELSALGKPSILIPLPTSGSRGDQIRNAEVFQGHGAAAVLEEGAAKEERFVALVRGLLADRDRLSEMGMRARSLARGNAASVIADLIVERISTAGGL